MKFKMVHENYNVKNLAESLRFYQQALNLKEVRRIENENFTICFLKNDESDFELELTHLNDHQQSYDLGENEFHLAFKVDDFEASYKLHQKMGCICYENHQMGIYFIEDPNGYWIEIIPNR